MKNTVTYRQFEKNLIRKNSLSYAVEVLTTKSSLCQNQRLNSPGVIITNFSEPDKKIILNILN